MHKVENSLWHLNNSTFCLLLRYIDLLDEGKTIISAVKTTIHSYRSNKNELEVKLNASKKIIQKNIGDKNGCYQTPEKQRKIVIVSTYYQSPENDV